VTEGRRQISTAGDKNIPAERRDETDKKYIQDSRNRLSHQFSRQVASKSLAAVRM
jgi:hypothetical protein